MNIRKELLKLKNEEYKEFNKKLCPDTKKELLGIKVPNIRSLSKEILKELSIDDALVQIKEEYFEEIILKGFVIAYSKMDFIDKKRYIEKFIPLIDSWAISDTFIPALKIKTTELEQAWKFIIPYTKSSKEFDIRFAVIMMLDYFIVDEYVDKVLSELDKIRHEGYYVKMGVAWCLAEIRNQI